MLKIIDVSKRFSSSGPDVVNQLSLDVEEGLLIALVGESGSGKTTLLRMIAGLEEPNSGIISMDGNVIFDSGTNLSPDKRKIGLVFQDNALFPHLNVSKNIGFGIDNLGTVKKKSEIERLLKLVNLEGLGKRYPHELSGGQQQRVALARALAPNPRLLLLDEPFSSLDGIIKEKIRVEIKNILKKTGITSIIVTHDINDALSISDKIAVIREGKILQYDSPNTIYNKPINDYVASMFGRTNIIKAEKTNNGYATILGLMPIKNNQASFLTLSIRPQYIIVSKNGIEGTIKEVSYYGNQKIVKIIIEEQEIVITVDGRSIIDIGGTLKFKVDWGKVHIIE